jgi:hypothetical protein
VLSSLLGGGRDVRGGSIKTNIGGVLRFREHRPRGERRRLFQFDVKKFLEACCSGEHHREEAYCELGALQGIQAGKHETSFELIEIPYPAVLQELRRHTNGLDAPGPMLHQAARDTFEVIQRLLGFS